MRRHRLPKRYYKKKDERLLSFVSNLVGNKYNQFTK